MGGVYFVYEHWRPDKDLCFYVGKGKTRRATVMYKRGRHHENIQKKLERKGMCVEIRMVASGLSEADAYALEVERIAFWRSVGVSLCNRSDGGEGGGSNPSAETRVLMRAAKIGRKLSADHKAKVAAKMVVILADPIVKAKIAAAVSARQSTPEARARQSAFFKAMPRTKEHYEKVAAALRGKKLSPEHIEKTRRANTGRKQSPEEIANRVAANTGKKRSPEFCARMKASWTPERKAAQGIRTAEMNRKKSRAQSDGDQ